MKNKLNTSLLLSFWQHVNISVLTTEQAAQHDWKTQRSQVLDWDMLEFGMQQDFGFLHVLGHCWKRENKYEWRPHSLWLTDTKLADRSYKGCMSCRCCMWTHSRIYSRIYQPCDSPQGAQIQSGFDILYIIIIILNNNKLMLFE